MDSVRVTDANGCNVYGFAFIDTTNCPGFYVYGATITNATCSTCSDGYAVAQVSSGSPPYTYSWGTSPVQTGQTATGLSPGNYDVCASDMTGCSACNNVTIGVGNCSAYFYMYPDTSLPNTYNAVNMATGVPPITYAWTWGDGSPLDSVAYPSNTYSALGVYTICLTITDSTGCMATSCDSVFLHRPSFLLIAVNVLPPVTTGISSYTPEKTFSVFPNPASDNLILRLPRADTAYVTIYNALGEIKFVSVITQRETTLNISSFSGGIYFIEVASGNKVSREKFVKQ
jgi:hypothetical protein